MRVILRSFLILLMLAKAARAFSLLGPYEDWMQPTNGFRYPDDIGGPMNLGEEYRWNVPVLTYSFDQSFVNYFGTGGVAAVEQAIEILNNLPPVSQLNPTNYPPESKHVNYQAAALNLVDLKSKTLATLLEQLGLAQPTRFAFNVHDFTYVGGNLAAQTIQRNFDSLDLSPTNLVNDTAYGSYLSMFSNSTSIFVTAEEYLIDPLATFQPAVADRALTVGEFHTGLTRDDIGGLRYLLSTNNINMEILLPDVHGIGTNSAAYVNQALRPGVDKITFVRRDYDLLLGQFFAPYTNQFTDSYISNNTVRHQQLERVITEPDILFSAEDARVPQIFRTGTSNWWKNEPSPGLNGPGLIRPPITLTYARTAELYITMDWLPDGSASGYSEFWGSFDSSTNPPVIYPAGTDAKNLTLNLQLRRDDIVVGGRSWHISLNTQESIVVETSTNLVHWVPYLVFSAGHNVEWRHHITRPQRYFRIVPNGS